MDFTLKVTIDLGPQTLAVLTNNVSAAKVTVADAKAVSAAPAAKMAVVAADPAAAPAKAAAAPAVAKPAAAPKTKPAAVEFEELDEDAQLEAIKTEVTRHTKKGKSADIKALLSHFDAGRASELDPGQYADFFEAVKRYGAGESVEEITGDLA